MDTTDVELLHTLRWYAINAPECMTDEARRMLGELEQKQRALQRERDAAIIAKWRTRLTRKLVRELERKSKSDEGFTGDELEMWFAAVELSKPNMATATEEALDAWYRTPVSATLFPPRASRTTRTHATPRASGSRRKRTTGTRRHRSPAREADDPEPSAADRRCAVCAGELTGRRDQRTCSPACRQRLSRLDREAHDFWTPERERIEARALELVSRGAVACDIALEFVRDATALAGG